MKNRRIYLLYLGLYLLSSFLIWSPMDEYVVTSGHSIAFKSADPSGKFTTITGNVSYTESNPEATKMSLTIPVTSLSTDLMRITGAQEPSGIPYVTPVVENKGPSRGNRKSRPNSSERRRRPR